MAKSPVRPQVVLVSITAEIKSRHGSLTLLVLISLDTQWGKSCEGPSPQADLKSFHPVVCKRALESMLAPSVGTDPWEVTPPREKLPWVVEKAVSWRK